MCEKQIDSLERIEDPVSAHIVFIARCHGETEVVRLSFETLVAMTGMGIGTAFNSRHQEEVTSLPARRTTTNDPIQRGT